MCTAQSRVRTAPHKYLEVVAEQALADEEHKPEEGVSGRRGQSGTCTTTDEERERKHASKGGTLQGIQTLHAGRQHARLARHIWHCESSRGIGLTSKARRNGQHPEQNRGAAALHSQSGGSEALVHATANV